MEDSLLVFTPIVVVHVSMDILEQTASSLLLVQQVLMEKYVLMVVHQLVLLEIAVVLAVDSTLELIVKQFLIAAQDQTINNASMEERQLEPKETVVVYAQLIILEYTVRPATSAQQVQMARFVRMVEHQQVS